MFDTLLTPLKELVEKNVSASTIDSTTLPASVMNRQQANKFVDLVVDESVLLKSGVRVVRVNHPKGQINRLDLAEIATEGAATVSTPTNRKPRESVIEYDMVKYRSSFNLTSDFAEDNLEGKSVTDTVMGMFAKRMRTDLEIAFLQSDSSLVTGDGQSASNNLLGINDGIRKILRANVPAANRILAAGKAPSRKLFNEALRKIPTRYQVAMPDYKLITSTNVAYDWMLNFSDRQTVVGDSVATGGNLINAFGVPLLPIPHMPNNLSYSGSDPNRTDIWLTPPSNLILFIQREFTVEWDRIPRLDQWEATVHWRVDFQVENPDLVVYIENVDVDGTDY